jgi:hypothetical protein
MLLTEAQAEAKVQRQSLFVTYTDASKAFDVVDHSSMCRHLYNRGVREKLWLAIDSMYTDTTSLIKWEGHVSSPIVEKQGIRQGGVRNPDTYPDRVKQETTSRVEKRLIFLGQSN